MLGYGAFPTTSSWWSTGTPLLRPVIAFGDVNIAEQLWERQWFFGPYVVSGNAGSYIISGEPATLIYTQIPAVRELLESAAGAASLSNTMESFFTMAENASAADTITNAKVIDVAMSEGATAEDTPGRTWNPINTPQTTTWTLIQTP